MGLIKASLAPTNLAPFSMMDIEAQAREILLRAQQRAEQLVLAAQKHADALKQQAHATGLTEGREQGLTRGYEQGHAAGLQQALDEQRGALTQLVAALNAATQQVEQSRQRLDDHADVEVMKLAIAMANRVTKRQGVLDPQVLCENVVAAVKMVVHSTGLRIAINPAQKQTLLEALPKLSLTLPALQHVDLVEDPNVAPGGCRIFTRNGLVDADLDEQLNRIAADLLPSAEVANDCLTPSQVAAGEGDVTREARHEPA